MKILSICQPWAYLISSGSKNIENRTWPTKYRGRFPFTPRNINRVARLIRRVRANLSYLLWHREAVEKVGNRMTARWRLSDQSKLL